MKHGMFLAAVLVLSVCAAAQDFEIDATTPEGQMLQQIGMTESAETKTALLEDFTSKYPAHKGAAWAWAQLSTLYSNGQQTDKALAACDKMIAAQPNYAAGAHSCLKIAEGLKNEDLIKDWGTKTFQAAKLVTSAEMPKFEFEDQVTRWKENVEFARQVGQYAEYSLYAAALASTDPAKKASLYETLKGLNPESQYLAQLGPQAFLAYRQAGENEKAVALAQELLKADPNQEDMIAAVAEHHMAVTKDRDKIVEYAQKLVDVMESKPAPEGIPADQWATKKKQLLGVGHWMIGITYSNEGKLVDADKELRAALPNLSGNQNMRAEALFHLGLANYKLGDSGGNINQQRILDAFNFTKQCAEISSPFQAQARKNLQVIQSQYRIR